MVESSRVIFVLSPVCYKGLFFLRFTKKEQLNNLALPYYRKLMLHEFKVLEINAA